MIFSEYKDISYVYFCIYAVLMHQISYVKVCKVKHLFLSNLKKDLIMRWISRNACKWIVITFYRYIDMDWIYNFISILFTVCHTVYASGSILECTRKMWTTCKGTCGHISMINDHFPVFKIKLKNFLNSYFASYNTSRNIYI